MKVWRVLLLASVVGLLCCRAPAAPRPPMAASGTVTHLLNATIALVRQHDDGTWTAYCSGVWVSSRHILTAHHCAEAAVRATDDAPASRDLSGRVVHYRIYADTYEAAEEVKWASEAVVVGQDVRADLALLAAVEVCADHSTAALAPAVPAVGARVHVVGHTMGMLYSYSPGWVGALRVMDNVDGFRVHLVQVFSAAGPGNSGGGVFGETGELVGIASFLRVDTSLVFFVDRNEVAAFLAREGL